MRYVLTIAMLATLMQPLYAGGRRRAAATSPSVREEVSITFIGVTGGGREALMDAGRIAQFRTRRVFGIRLDAPGKTGTATLRAYLESFDGRATVRVDGKTLGLAPIVIDAQAPLGGVTMHTLEIEIPPTVPEGAFASAVRWEVTTN
ncbi:MAG: hypothetical protein JO197_19475 [Acidobacteria bacterium]|nr:hypothetical protein [Acidobacteriota bacterium]MBV9477011.1 hypothetical protein [Acidobacteriota bacterium]